MNWYKLFPSKETLLEALGPEQRRIVKIGARKVCLIWHEERFYAFDNLCPHNKHSLLEGVVNYIGEIVCPLHAYRYSLHDGGECEGRSIPLKIHQLVEKEDGMYLGLVP